jgi:hypothetical protein
MASEARPVSTMKKLYSYILRYDNGAAPNPFWGICTLTICKPAIRRTAQIGDWIIGTGSKNTRLREDITVDLSDCLVYGMKVTDKKSLTEYDTYCNYDLKNKIPEWRTKDWRLRMGDCIYDFSNGKQPTIRKSVHTEKNRERDLGGHNALLSDHFYYFGEAAIPLPPELQSIIKKGQGHRLITQTELVANFENWIFQYKRNCIYGDPQLRWEFDRLTIDEIVNKCSACHSEDDEDESEETIC